MSQKAANILLYILYFTGACLAFWLLKIHMALSVGESDLQSSCSVFASSGHGCEIIALSDFSKVWIFPLAGLALGYFLSQILLLTWANMNPQTRYEPLYTSLNLATISIVVTLLMATLSFFVVKSLCIGCMGLWAVNILVWLVLPSRIEVKLSNALQANLEVIRHKDLKLSRSRVRGSYIATAVIVFAVAGIAAAMIASEKQRYNAGGSEAALGRYANAPQIYLPAEALEGESAKGAPTQEAVLKIVKFADFQCPACKRAAQLFKPFFLRHQDKIHYIFRNYPLDSACNPHSGGPHYMACAAAAAGICAAKQGKFYEYHDLIFDGQDKLNPALIKETAEKIGLDIAKFQDCTKSQATKDEIMRDISWGDGISLNSTPTFVINGHKVEGGFSPEQWEEIFQAALKGK